MKKSFILIILLCTFAFVGVFGIQKTLLSEKDNVIITEHVIFGDKSKIEDVTLERNVQLKKNIYWKTNYTAAEPSVYDTDYMFYEKGYSQEYQFPHRPIYFNLNLHYDFDAQKEESQMQGLELAYKKVFDETPNGEERFEIVKVKDYLDYYLFDLDVFLSAEWRDIHWEEELYWLNKENVVEARKQEAKERLAILEAFHTFFKIPLLENQFCEIGVAKTKNGMLGGWSYSTYDSATASGNISASLREDSENSATNTDTYYLPETHPMKENEDEFAFSVNSMVIGNTCYLAFDTHTDKGNIVDTSLIPGGYGIYSFTFDEEQECIDTDSLKMVYSLNPNIEFVTLEQDKTGEHILLFTEEQEQCYLTVIDIQTMETKQKIAYAPNIEENKTRCYWIYDDFIIAQYLYEKAVVISKDETDTYHVEFTIDVSDEEKKQIYEDMYIEETDKLQENIEVNTYIHPLEWIGGNMVFDWNGTELLLSDSLVDVTYYRGKCGFYLAVFDKNGIQYYGEYTCSLDTGDETGDYYNYNCRPTDDDSLMVYWEEK